VGEIGAAAACCVDECGQGFLRDTGLSHADADDDASVFGGWAVVFWQSVRVAHAAEEFGDEFAEGVAGFLDALGLGRGGVMRLDGLRMIRLAGQPVKGAIDESLQVVALRIDVLNRASDAPFRYNTERGTRSEAGVSVAKPKPRVR
jgi:hypothetical protein